MLETTNSLSRAEGKALVKLARRAIETFLKNGQTINMGQIPASLEGERAVFVSLYGTPATQVTLRGCVGITKAVMPVHLATVKAAILAATSDPRFPQVKLVEMDDMIVEVSALTHPTPINAPKISDVVNEIEVGRDGLMIDGGASGLLLPQVGAYYGWEPEDFLSHLCIKAGLQPTYWVTGKLKLFKFQAQIFEELEPRGSIREKKLTESPQAIATSLKKFK